MDESIIDIPRTPQVTEKAEDEGGKGTKSISSSIRQTPEVTEKTENEGGETIYSFIPQTPEVTEKTENEGGETIYSFMLKRGKAIFSSMLKGGKGIFSMQKSIVNRPGSSHSLEKANDQVGIPPQPDPGSSQPPEKANDQVAIPAQSNNVPRMFLDGSESKLLALEEMVKNMIGDSRKWYERRLGDTRMMASYSDEELRRKMAQSGLLLLEVLRSLADSPRSSNEFFQPKEPRSKERLLSAQEAVIKMENRIPIFVLKKILEWERDADKDENRLGSDGEADGDADKDENRGCRWGCMQIKMKTGERDADKDENRQADTDLHSILKQAWLKLSPILYDDSHVIDEVQLKDDSHLLEFLYENIIGSSTGGKNKRRGRRISLPQAEQLKGKGVKFAANEGLLNKIRFDRRNLTLYLPAIKMDGGTGAVLTNLVLFEASKQGKRSQPLMSYVDLMERLIDTPEDVQALRNDGIIQCHLATNIEAANVWNGMRNLLPNKKFKYEPIDKAIHDVNSFYTSKYRTMGTECYRKYFSKPWSALSLFAACILLGLAAFQTYLAWEQVRLQRESMPKT